MLTKNLRKPIDNICFWYDPVLGSQYLKKQDVPPLILSRCEYYDSVLEFKLYGELLGHFSEVIVERQHTIQLMPKITPFKAWNWCVDFKINTPKPIYIEAKGKWILDSMKAEGFWKNLRVLQATQPAVWNRLFFIGSNKDDIWHLPQSTIQVHPIKELPHLLKMYGT